MKIIARPLRRWRRALKRSVFDVCRPQAVGRAWRSPLVFSGVRGIEDHRASRAVLRWESSVAAAASGTAHSRPASCPALSSFIIRHSSFPRIPLARALVSALLIGGLLAQPLAGQGAWELDPEVIHPSEREKHTMTQSGSKIYLFGGLATMALDDLWQFDPATGAWVQIAPSGTPPPARHAGVAGQFLDFIFHYSGLTASGSLSSVMLSYGPSANLWSTVVQNGTAPGGRRDATLAEHTTGLFLFGGYSNAAGTTLADAFLYRFTAVSAVQGTWTKLASCPAGPLAETAVAALPDPATGQTHLYYYGGVTTGGTLSGKLMDYNVATGAWTEIVPASAPG